MRFLAAVLLLLLALPAQAQSLDRAIVVGVCNAGAFSAGNQAYPTMDTTGRLCTHKTSAGSGCAQATAYLARTTGGNEGGNAANITTLICGLVIDGVWSNLDALYVLAQQNQADAQLNLIGTSYGLGTFGLLRSVNFTSYAGFGGFGIGVGLDTGFDPSIAPSPHYVQNSASLGIWSYAINQTGYSQFGQNTATTNSVIYNKFTSGNFIGAVNSPDFPAVSASITKGLFAADRTNAANVALYQNGVTGAPVTSTSSAVTGGNFMMPPGNSGGGPHGQVLSEAHVGASLGASLELALYNRLRTYMTAVGVP